MKYPKAYVLYANENYIDIVNTCAKSIKTFSNFPVFVYLLNSDRTIWEADKTFNWECDIDVEDTEEMYYCHRPRIRKRLLFAETLF
jgi:hypothetical protein